MCVIVIRQEYPLHRQFCTSLDTHKRGRCAWPAKVLQCIDAFMARAGCKGDRLLQAAGSISQPDGEADSVTTGTGCSRLRKDMSMYVLSMKPLVFEPELLPMLYHTYFDTCAPLARRNGSSSATQELCPAKTLREHAA